MKFYRKSQALFLILIIVFGGISSAQTLLLDDPSRIGVGARPLGMGKAYLGQAGDVSSIFLNPAGLSNLKNWQGSSMSGKFLNLTNYLNLGGGFPTKFGTFGIGYIGADISYTGQVATIEGGKIIIITGESASASFTNSVLLCSWAANLRENLSLGATLKNFFKNLTGTETGRETATGMDLDLGIQYRHSSVLRFGLVAQNVLGGKIKWEGGYEEKIPPITKSGLSLIILGENGLRQLRGNELALNLDAEFAPNKTLYHAGMEWSPVQFLDLRVGVDQDLTPAAEVSSNLTAGVGFYLRGFCFDYAYHQYYGLPGNDTHYISLSYGVWKEKLPMGEPLVISSPSPDAILYEEKIKVTGKVWDLKIEKLTLDGIEIPFKKTGEFESDFLVKLGSSEIVVAGLDEKDKVIETKKVRVTRLLTFKDIPSGHFAKSAIEKLATSGIMGGFPDGTFRPEESITQEELRAVLAKVSPEAVVSPGPPNQKLSRAEGISILVRFAGLDSAQPAPEIPFPDLPGRHWAFREVNAAYRAGWLDYLKGKPFGPKENFTRAEAAYILAKLQRF